MLFYIRAMKIFKAIMSAKSVIERKNRFLTAASALLLPACILIMTEAIHRGSLYGAFCWMCGEPLWAVSSYIFLMAAYILSLGVTNNLFAAFLIFSLPPFICVVVSRSKMAIREIPFMPWNMVMLRELFVAISESGILAAVFIAAAIPAILIIVFLFFIAGKSGSGYSVRQRAAASTAAALVLTAGAVSLHISGHNSEPSGIYTMDALERYHKCGFTGAFMSYAFSPQMTEPEGYSDDIAADILTAAQNSQTDEPEGSQIDESYRSHFEEPKIGCIDMYPDIIMVLGEAFWDPLLLTDFDFHDDPVPNLRRLMKESLYGELIVNSLGANTTNVEFEVLSGFSTSFLQPDLGIYYDVLNRRTPGVTAMPLRLAGFGYYAEAIHPYHRFYLNRDRAFKKMGFQTFVTDGFAVPEGYKGKYIPDSAVYEKILELHEAHIFKAPDKPYFSFSITMQNHFDYKLSNYGGNEDRSAGNSYTEKEALLSEEEEDILQGYLKGVGDTDKLLGDLAAKYSDSSRKVIIIFFGDHIPALGKGFSLLWKGGLIDDPYPLTDNSQEDILKLHKTPFIIWDNFTDRNGSLGMVSAPYLQHILFREYGLPLDSFQALMLEAADKVPFLGLAGWKGKFESDFMSRISDATGREAGGGTPDESNDLNIMDKVRMAQYFLLYRGK